MDSGEQNTENFMLQILKKNVNQLASEGGAPTGMTLAQNWCPTKRCTRTNGALTPSDAPWWLQANNKFSFVPAESALAQDQQERTKAILLTKSAML